MNKGFLTFWVVLMFVLSGCEHRRVTLAGVPATPYHKTHNHLTQYKKMYGLEKVIFQTYATYYSKPMRMQYVDEYAKIYKLNAIEKQTLLDTLLEEERHYDVFFISHFSSDPDYQAIQSQIPNQKIWALTLEENGMQIRPETIETMRLTAQQKHFHPQVDGFSKLYRVRFRKSTLDKKTLHLNSPAAHIRFTWKKY